MSDDVTAAAEAIVAAAWVDAVRDQLPGIAQRLGASADAADELGLDAAAELADGVRGACAAVAADDVARVLVAVAAEVTDMGLADGDLLAAVLLLAADQVTRDRGAAA